MFGVYTKKNDFFIGVAYRQRPICFSKVVSEDIKGKGFEKKRDLLRQRTIAFKHTHEIICISKVTFECLKHFTTL